MIKCLKCGSPDGVVKAGFIRGSQRYHCKSCQYHFSLPSTAESTISLSRPVTIVDVAKSLGVAPSTVSRALNGKTDINVNTRQAILNAALALDYKPNLLAQSLNRGKTYTIGVVIPNIERPFFAGVLAGIQQVASNAGYRVMICQSNESHLTETLNVQALIDSRVDGLLISHSKETVQFDHLHTALQRGIPMVHFDRVCNQLNTPKVMQEDFRGSIELVEHLIEKGCRRIAILAGPEPLLISQTRLEGYKTALQKHGLPIDNDLIFHGNFKKEDSLRALKHWMTLPQAPDGVFAIHYQNAIEMMGEAKRMGVAIPQQLAFVGFGDELLAELYEPSLTVFHLFPQRVGETAARMLLEHIVKPEAHPYQLTVQGQMLVRDSSLRLN